MEDARISDCPVTDHDELVSVIRDYGGAIVLRCDGLLGSEAQAHMLAVRKATGELPAYDKVWVGAIEDVAA